MKTLKKILANVLGINEDAITNETSQDNTETWDSFNGLMLVSELENAFGIIFTMDEVRQIKNVGDIRAILEKKGAKFVND